MRQLKMICVYFYLKVYKPLAVILLILAPYITMHSYRMATLWRGYHAYGGELFVPLYFIGAVVGLFYLAKHAAHYRERLSEDAYYRRCRDYIRESQYEES